MLRHWTALNSDPHLQNHQKETSEQLEQRLRSQYEVALAQHRRDPSKAAQILSRLSSEMSISKKRPRLPQPLWKRRLRHAVNRNLAAAHDALQQPVLAARAYAAALDDDPSDFLVWVRAARAAAQSGRLHVARKAYEVALLLRPSHCLAASHHAAVTRAIGDADEDIDQSVSRDNDRCAMEILRHRCDYMRRELDNLQPLPLPEKVIVEENSWACLIDALRSCLQRRLQSEGSSVDFSVGNPVAFEIPQFRARPSPTSSDDVQVVMETPAPTTQDVENDIEIISDSSPCQSDGGSREQASRSSLVASPVLCSSRDTFKHKVVGCPTEPTVSRKADIPEDQHSRKIDAVKVKDTQESALVTRTKTFTLQQKTVNGSQVISSQELCVTNDTKLPEAKFLGSAEMGVHNHDSMESDKLGSDIQKRPEVRRSSRARASGDSAYDAERRQTRNATGAIDVATVDAELVQTLLNLCTNEHHATGTLSKDQLNLANSNVTDNQALLNEQHVICRNQRISSWTTVIDEHAEAEEVRKCIALFRRINSGPADLLLRLLHVLSEIRVVQYSSTLALLWSTLRDRLRLHMPGAAATSALVAEAMISSGRKAGKVKAQRFLEAFRLLSNIVLPYPLDEEARFLEIRLSWCWTLLYECRGEMQLSFASTEHTLSLLQKIKLDPTQRIPDSAGPDLAGYSYSALLDFIGGRLTRLKSARDLEKAEEELRRAGKGDREAAKRTVTILGSSVRAAIRSLRLDLWDEDDLKTTFRDTAELEQWEARLDAEVDLEPRLRVFGTACAQAADIVGELVCFSVRLRMAVRYYAATLRNEAEKEGGQTKSRDTSETRLADLLVQIRRYVALIKKIAAPTSSALWNCDIGITEWSMENAISIALLTIVSLTKLIITKIPVLKFSTGTELGASQKNRRLGFTRCMLAFARCIYVMEKCKRPRNRNQELDIDESSFTIKMLFTTSFCLRALVARGCCREEGTSGALMKLYVKFLSFRIQNIASSREGYRQAIPFGESTNKKEKTYTCNAAKSAERDKEERDREEQNEDNPEYSAFEDETAIPETTAKYAWSNVRVLRHELAQCYECLYQIPDIETGLSSGEASTMVRWLEEGCRVSKEIGLSFITGDPVSSSPTIDVDVCCSLYFFYRKRIFQLFCQRRREGGRSKRLREVLSRLAEALPEDAPRGVPMLPFQALDTIVSEVVDSSEDISKQAAENVSRLEEEWIREELIKEEGGLAPRQMVSNIQFSILYFEVFSLHAMSILNVHDSEYKRHKSAERRKHPKEAVERVLTASSECLIALRSRPWSVGSWILLGRIFVEIADLALDERELNLSTFGASRSESLQSLGEGDCIATIFGRAEACFGFAESLLEHSWAGKACNRTLPAVASSVLGIAFDGASIDDWKGFGDDGDLFGLFGLTNNTTSRPGLEDEKHPEGGKQVIDSRRLAAIRFGSTALLILRLREERYFHVHWTHSSLEPKLNTHPSNRFPDATVNLSTLALRHLRSARQLFGMEDSFSTSADTERHILSPLTTSKLKDTDLALAWRQDHVGVERLMWFYSLMEAKLLRKVGSPPAEYLAVFHRALLENKKVREQLKQPPDIEPVYQLHAARMKILRSADDSANALNVLNLLEKYSFKTYSPPAVEDFPGKDIEDWVAERKTAVAEDILAAMHFCSSRKSEVMYSEFYFKSAFCKAVLLAEVLKDIGSALEELGKCFRLDAAVKSLDQGHDAAHRGYFYKIWNYRFTDTGIEPAMETERKLVRWRGKLLGFYGQLLKQTGDWRSLAAIIYRLKKRNAEDLPVDGALLDDILEAYAITSRAALLSSMEKGIVTDVSAFESSYHRTWYIFEESLRLSQGVRRIRVGLNRGEKNETGAHRLILSGRPRCLVPMHTVLRLEHVRWQSALEGVSVNLTELKQLPTQGRLKHITRDIRMSYATTLQVSVGKWRLDEKMMKLLVRRNTELTAMEE